MKHLLTLILIITALLNLNASDWIELQDGVQKKAVTTLLSSNESSSTFHFALPGYWKNEVETSKGLAWIITADKSGSLLEKGMPDLPIFATSLIIPNQANMKVRIVSSQYEEFNNVLVAPSKGNLLRNVNPDDIPYEYGKQYIVNSFYPKEISSLRSPYIVRDFRAQTVMIQPMQYNAVTKILRVYYEITIELYENGISKINTLPHNNLIISVDKSFNDIYAHHFLNYNKGASRYTPVEEMGNMLIISYGHFMDEMQPFIDWKIMSGTPVEIVDVATVGGASAIEQYIEDYYNTNGLTFVLLVGDAAQVPTGNAGGNDSDVKYSYVAGNDHYPDLFIGRFSAQTDAHVITQVDRVLNYEQNPISDTAWYSEIIGIASNQGPGDDNESDYQHNRNINTKLLNFTYTSAYEFYDGNQGGNDAAGNPTQAMVSSAINSGATIINYTGHGSNTSWGTSGFSNSQVNNLTNNGKLPFIFSVACVNGNFVNLTCFAEAWMRAENNGEPSGAIGTLMSTINQSWNPPMRGQDEMNDILSEIYSDNIKRSFGGIAMNGCMNMNDVYGTAGDEMTDTWTIFGDPSVEIRTATPQVMVVTNPTSVVIGSTSMSLTCNADGAMATLSMNGEIIGSAIVEGGSATITFNALSTIGTMDFVVTSFNYIPYISTVDIISDGGAFITYSTNLINDIAGNNDGLMDYTEDIFLTVGLMNEGVDDAIGVTATLFTSSEYVELITTEATYGNISANDTVSVVDGFQFIVSDDIPNEIIANFLITAQDVDGEIWESTFMLTGHSPVLQFTEFEIDDSNGNNNGKIEPGETVDIIVGVSNNGSSEAYNVLCELQTPSQYVTVNSGAQSIGNMIAGEEEIASFSITTDGGTPEGILISFEVNILADHNISGLGNFTTIVGQKPVLILDLAHSSSLDSMVACFAELQVGIDIAAEWTADIDNYNSVFVLLGIFPNNYSLDDTEGAALASYLEDGGRVYMEGGNAWFSDNQTIGHELFYIDGIADGTDDLGIVVGDNNGIMEGYSFEYGGANNYIDRIAPKPESALLFSNESPEYGIGVSFENETYKTIGASFEFAGLVDRQGSTKDGVMAEILYFFDISYNWVGVDDNLIHDVKLIAFPNPAKSNVVIQFMLIGNNYTSLSVYDIAGRVVGKIIIGEYLSSGIYSFNWNTTSVGDGIYFYQLIVGSELITKKIVINK